jgi:hypothetical protein
MKFSQIFWRGLVFLILIAALCGGFALPVTGLSVRAAPQGAACAGTTVTQWTFDGNVTTPSTGSGTFTAGPGLTGQAFFPGASGAPGDLAIRYNSWTTSTSLNAMDYVEFIVSTVGRSSISFSFDYRSTGSGPANLEIHYFDGTNFVPFGARISLTTDSQFHALSFDLSTITLLDNNPNATFRLYGYSASGGNLGFDNVTITDCFSPAELTGTAADVTNTAASNLTNTAAAANLTGTAAALNKTGTAAANQTGSAMPTSTITRTPTPTGLSSVIINEVAWAGTVASSSDEWIELRNTTQKDINLAGWLLEAVDGSPSIPLNGHVIRGKQGLLLLSRNINAFKALTPDIVYKGSLGNGGEILRLFAPGRVLVDTANQDGGKWPAGIASPTYASMERKSPLKDNAISWYTFAGTPVVRDRKDNWVRGTPGLPNWAVSVTATPSLTPTVTRTPTLKHTPTRTLPPPPPPPLLVINEFVPRPGHDWNNDGLVNVSDEYIEILNHGTIPVNLNGYSLDDEVNIGSTPFRLPGVTLQPGQRMVFYGNQTNLLLSDGGDGVRLLRPNGQLMDAYNYFVVRFPDQSFCRLPDDGGADDWNTNCYPTPGLRNALSGSFVSPPKVDDQDLLCPIADTLPLDFILAECPPFGTNIFRPAYWDNPGWYDEKYLPQGPGKWPVFAD